MAVLMLAVSLLVVLQIAPGPSPAAAPSPGPLPDGNAFVRGLAAKQRERAEVLDDYTYDVLVAQEDIGRAGQVTRRRTRNYETFFVQGRPVRRQVTEDGRPLSAQDQEKEDRKAVERAAEIRKGAQDEEKPGQRLVEVLERFDFRTVLREDVDGRPTVVLDFQPRPGKRDLKGDVALRHLAGRLWVDEAEHEVVRADIHNTGTIKMAWGLGASVSEVRIRIDYRKVDGAAWLPVRDETTASGRVLLLKTFRTRFTRVYGRYRKFDVSVEETPGAAH